MRLAGDARRFALPPWDKPAGLATCPQPSRGYGWAGVPPGLALVRCGVPGERADALACRRRVPLSGHWLEDFPCLLPGYEPVQAGADYAGKVPVTFRPGLCFCPVCQPSRD